MSTHSEFVPLRTLARRLLKLNYVKQDRLNLKQLGSRGHPPLDASRAADCTETVRSVGGRTRTAPRLQA
jgi:hypothetical protein